MKLQHCHVTSRHVTSRDCDHASGEDTQGRCDENNGFGLAM